MVDPREEVGGRGVYRRGTDIATNTTVWLEIQHTAFF